MKFNKPSIGHINTQFSLLSHSKIQIQLIENFTPSLFLWNSCSIDLTICVNWVLSSYLSGHLTSKSDVYSFGVVLLEILTGRRSMDKKRPSGEQNLVAWARPYLAEKRKLYQLVDPRLELNYSLKGVQKVSQLAYNCLSRDPKSRPNMDEVVKVLTPLQDLNDLAILSYHSRVSQQGRRKKKSDGTQQITYTQSKSIRDSPLNTGKQQKR